MLPLLRAVSHYSLLYGVLSPEAICRMACKFGYRAVCIADRDNLYSLPQFLDACRSFGLKAIIGAELTNPDTGSILLFADGDKGYANLCRIISKKNISGRIDVCSIVEEYREGLHVASESAAIIKRLVKSGPAYYRMDRPRRLPAWVKEGGITCLITPPAAFASNDDFRTHCLLRAIAGKTTLSRLKKEELLPVGALLLEPEIIRGRFEAFEEALQTTESFAENIRPISFRTEPIMPVFPSCEGAAELLRKKTYEGAAIRYGKITAAIARRIDYELGLIVGKGFADYFLIVEDIVSRSPRTCGRGSAAASIVAYSLGITNVDPIRYNLMFERFLNPGRNDPPDIDVDFAWDERDKVIEYVFERYGKEHVAMVSTHQSFGARMAIREVARVYGMTEDEISGFTGKIPWFLDIREYAGDLEGALRRWPSFKDVSFDHPWPDILRDACRIIGFPRGVGTHCGGVIITPQPVSSVAPVQISAKGFPIVQWDKDGVETMGLVKIDLLGNRSLAVIRDAVSSIKSKGIGFDERNWDPQSDPETQKLLAEGNTIGVFYVESPAMRLLQKKSRKGDFDHLVIHSSIIRPAANKYIREYLRRLHGAAWKPLHPLLEEAFKETFGIMVYQEDVSRAAMALADFSAAEADALRKIIAKKGGSATLDDFRERFFEGAAAKGVSEEVIREVWEMMESFSGYSFCKPHSASYVQVSYQSAWLKARFPAHFMAAVLSNYGGFYTTQAYVSEAMRLGLKVIPPDVNKSAIKWAADGLSITVGLCQIKGLSAEAQRAIVASRERQGLFLSVENLLERTKIGESDAERLILAGACDKLPRKLNRAEQFWKMRTFFQSGKNGSIPQLREFSQKKCLMLQYRLLGFIAECHPITLIKSNKKRSSVRAVHIRRLTGKNVSLFGWCVTSKTVTARSGESMEFVTFEDETGIFETVFFPPVYRQYSALLAWQEAFIVTGKATSEFDAVVLEVAEIERLGGMWEV